MAEERKLAHLNMIQGVVTRMATNSFQMKGWVVLLVSGLFGLAAADTNRRFDLVLVELAATRSLAISNAPRRGGTRLTLLR